MRKIFFYLFLFVAVFPSKTIQAQTFACKNSICFESSKKIGGQEIPIHGIALLEYLKFDLYTAALYAPAGTNSIDAVLGNVPKSLILNYHRGIKKEWMIKASRNRIQKNHSVSNVNLEDRLKLLDSAYQSVKKNDRYELRYEPGLGTSLILNGQIQATIPGEDFQRAFFGIWLSDVPLNSKLRDALLTEK